MIRFFRRIRQRLLSERKATKYLLYAIGEIVLVVIGILIALKINNWNTDRQDAKTLNGYLNNIGENIRVDRDNLATIKNFRDSSIVGSRYFMGLIEQPAISREDFTAYFSRYFKYNPWLDESFQSDQSGFEALKNSGYLSRLQQTEIEIKLYHYYSLVEKIRREEQSLNNFMEEMEYDMYKGNVVHLTKTILGKIARGTETRADIEELNELVNYPSFVGSHSRNAGVDYLNELYGALAKTAAEVQHEMERVTDGRK